jgi:hypothetical protein
MSQILGCKLIKGRDILSDFVEMRVSKTIQNISKKHQHWKWPKPFSEVLPCKL